MESKVLENVCEMTREEQKPISRKHQHFRVSGIRRNRGQGREGQGRGMTKEGGESIKKKGMANSAN